MILPRAFFTWFVIIVVESVHGMLRSLLLVPWIGDFPARQVSVVTGSLLILGVAYLFIRWIAAENRRQLLGVGVMWVVWTVLFEVGLGRLALDLPWQRIAEDYDIRHGGILGLGLLFMSLTPLMAARLRGVPPSCPG